MLIGIDASRAFVKNKTGIEEYSYQVIKHLRDELKNEQVILYLNPKINRKEHMNFDLPENWELKFLRAPIFWTQVRLSLEMLFSSPDALFVPAHTVPIFHPKNTIVTIHGLEYEFCPKAYSFWQKLYMRWSIKKSCQWARKVIAVSKNTKKDLMKLYKVPEEKIEVIYEGISENNFQFSIFNFQKIFNDKIFKPYILCVGRLEERKNICGMIKTFEILKSKYNISHKLILAGKFGYGENHIKYKIANSKYKEDIVLAGYVSDGEKWELLKNADVFLFPTFYEGFGLPILEAQRVGRPVVTSNISSMPEVTGVGAVLVDPKDINAVTEAVYKLISDESYKNDIIEKGLENVKRFSWERCASSIAQMLIVANDKN